jgi:hypothetical protein
MPGVEHTGNSGVTALVTGDTAKAKALSRKYGITTLVRLRRLRRDAAVKSDELVGAERVRRADGKRVFRKFSFASR